uniref:Kinetochore protein NDC80 n=1 Tax=Nothobranchius kadleci TaxID=1051664 RepID=A0A1A8BI74_NOTKA
MSTVYATPRSQPSFGKLSLAKPSSVSSERRTSFFGARTSGASMHRNSTMSGFGGTEKIKDSRPLHDKSYVQQCIKQLHEFLVEQGFPGTLSSKTLQSPSTKEFVKMFEFIYCQLDPTFVMPNSKVEEEVPALLKALGYPFVLSKCSMYSVGAPHTWPQALGALMWLIDSVKISLSFGKQDPLLTVFCEESDNIEEGAEYNKLFLDFTERINREKRELEQTVANLTKALEDAEQHTWNEEIALSKVKGKEWGAEIENIENHRKLLEEKVKFGYDEAVQQLKAIQQQYQLVLQETSEERRTVANNLMSVFTAVTNHLAVTELSLADLHSGVHRICKKTVEENEAALQKLYEMLKSFKAKANV